MHVMFHFIRITVVTIESMIGGDPHFVLFIEKSSESDGSIIGNDTIYTSCLKLSIRSRIHLQYNPIIAYPNTPIPVDITHSNVGANQCIGKVRRYRVHGTFFIESDTAEPSIAF